MRFDFETSRDIVLRATYETLVLHAEYEMFSAAEVHKLVQGHFGLGYVRRLLSSLAEEGLIAIEKFDEHSLPDYSISDDGIRRAEELSELEILLDEDSNISDRTEIPASDRIVLRSDNMPAAENATKALEELKAELASNSNEVGDAFGDQRDFAIREVSQLEEMSRQPRIRVESILSFAKTSLTWIAEKAGAASVGEIAKKALALLFAWLNP